MNLKNFHIHATRAIVSDSIRLDFFERLLDGKIAVLSNMTFETIDPSIVYEPKEFVSIPIETAQELIDNLWQCGLRPSEGSGSAGSLRATENHLKSTEEILRRLLAIVEHPAAGRGKDGE